MRPAGLGIFVDDGGERRGLPTRLLPCLVDEQLNVWSFDSGALSVLQPSVGVVNSLSPAIAGDARAKYVCHLHRPSVSDSTYACCISMYCTYRQLRYLRQ